MWRASAFARTEDRTMRFLQVFGNNDNTLYRRRVWTIGSVLCLIKCFLRTVEFGMHIYKFLKYTIFTAHEVAQKAHEAYRAKAT